NIRKIHLVMAKNSIEFKLFAPRNSEAKLLGTFSNWDEIKMLKDEHTGYFQVSIPLEDGIYRYKFFVKSQSPSLLEQPWQYVPDPYSTCIDKTTLSTVIRIKNGSRLINNDEYRWLYDSIRLPDNSDLIIYEFLVADFIPQGKFIDAIAKLDYLVEIGVNALELMPVHDHKNKDWGYLTRNYFALDSTYGSSEEFKHFIDQCHSKGIRIILDCVFNHSDADCPLHLIDREYWYYKDKHHPEDLVNHWINPTLTYIGDVIKYWIKEYHIDGIRFDALKQLDNEKALKHFDDICKQTIKDEKPFITVGEYVPDSPQIVKPQGPLDSVWRASFKNELVPQLIIKELYEVEKIELAVDCKQQGYSTSANVINYLSSHDNERLMRILGDCHLFDEPAFRLALIAQTLLLTAVGIPMMYMGSEFAEYKLLDREDPNFTKNSHEPHWSLATIGKTKHFFDCTKLLTSLRKRSKAVRSDNIDLFHRHWASKIAAYSRWCDNERVIVVTCLSEKDRSQHYIPNFPTGKYHEIINDSNIEVTDDDNGYTLDLMKNDVKVFELKIGK
ncbi:unnamed protein product, partial [Didymodactylos carnosus]